MHKMYVFVIHVYVDVNIFIIHTEAIAIYMYNNLGKFNNLQCYKLCSKLASYICNV